MYSVLKSYVLAHKFAKVINRGKISPHARKEFNVTDKIFIFPQICEMCYFKNLYLLQACNTCVYFYCRFHDKLQINFLESQVRLIPLTSYGQGTTIVSDPPLTPQLDLGPNFR